MDLVLPHHTSRLARIEALFQQDDADRVDAPFVTVEQWLELQSRGDTVLVDVRLPAEREISMIPGAITKEAFEAQPPGGARTVVCYCTIGGRSGRYVESLRARGIEALNLKGSVLLWAHAGKSFVDPSGQETRRVHVSGERWNLLPDGYEAVW